jgi:hypothetical protein
LYNGTGYEDFHHEASPYDWGATDREQGGKYTSDGKFDSNAWDTQVGCAAMLMAMMAIDPTITFADSPHVILPTRRIRRHLTFRSRRHQQCDPPSPTLPRAPSARSSGQFSLQSSKGKADVMFGIDLSFALGFAAGGALIWFAKDKIQALIIGGHALAIRLENKAAEIRTAL